MNDEARAPRYSDLFASGHEHSPDCAYCPICATIAVVRKTRPEVLEHMASAARELIMALGILIDEASEVIGSVEHEAKPASDETAAGVRRIDIG